MATKTTLTILALLLAFAGGATANYLWSRVSTNTVDSSVARVLVTDTCARRLQDVFEGMKSVRVRTDTPTVEIIEFDYLPRELSDFLGFAEIRFSEDMEGDVGSAIRSAYLECSATDHVSISLDDPFLASKLRAEIQRQAMGGFIGTNARIVEGTTLEVYGAYPSDR
jgi:hypothetical protein